MKTSESERVLLDVMSELICILAGNHLLKFDDAKHMHDKISKLIRKIVDASNSDI